MLSVNRQSGIYAKKLLKCKQLIASCSFQSCSSTNAPEEAAQSNLQKLKKTSATAINIYTNERSVVELSERQDLPKFKKSKLFCLPQAAKDGLRNALLACSHNPKQLQNEADQLGQKLEQRRFPASPEQVKAARDEIKNSLRKNDEDVQNDETFHDSAMNEKIKEAQEYELRNKVDKVLKKSTFNWRPLEIETREAAAAYSLARLAANYAEISRCLAEFSLVPDFVPSSVLDFGSGSGAGFWAVTSRWPKKDGKDAVRDITLVDLSDSMVRFAMDAIRQNSDNSSMAVTDSSPFTHDNVAFRRHLLPSLQTTYDLVIAHRVLCEIGSPTTRLQTVQSLWERTNRFLVLIESSLAGGFGGLLEARDFILTSGVQLDAFKLRIQLEKAGLMSDRVFNVLDDRRLSEYERYNLIREMVPAEMNLPTKVPTASVLAPCPHDLGCPMNNSVCSFSTRFEGIRADGKRSEREKDGSEVTKFTFMILEKTPRAPNSYSERILKNRKLHGHVTCDVCTAFRGIQRMTLSKKHGPLYQRTKSRADGDVFPLRQHTISSNAAFDFWESVVEQRKSEQ